MARLLYLCFFLITASGLIADDSIHLRDHLKDAKAGDFIVAAQNKNYTLLHIYSKKDNHLVVEEITIPMTRINLKNTTWREWVLRGAPANTSWILYTIDLATAKPQKYYSVSRCCWFEMPERDNFLSTLLNLHLHRLTTKERKKIGSGLIPNAESRQVWNPKLIVDGETIPNASFDAWRTRWPQDGTEAAGKTIEVYTPQNPKYPSYFPYWLQISGVVGNAKVRVVDSGSGLMSPAPVVFD